MDYLVVGCLPCKGKFQGLSLVEKDNLEIELTDLEIYNAIFSMASVKVSRVDRFHARFY